MDTNTLRLQLIKELNIEGFSLEDQEHVIVELGENIMKQFIIDVYDSVPVEKRAEFSALINAGSRDALIEFLYPLVPDVELLLARSSQKIIAELKAA